MRAIAREFNCRLYAHRNITNSQVRADLSLYEALHTLPRDTRGAVVGWLSKRGPFWDDDAKHDSNDYFECGDDVVTDTAVGEAAYCAMVGIDRSLVSLSPSDWEYSPLTVRLVSDNVTDIAVQNYWHQQELITALQAAQPPIASWSELEAVARFRFQRLSFSVDCFQPLLNGQPFLPGKTDAILSRLDVLNQLMGLIGAAGQWLPTGQALYQKHFTGDNAWFSDSSDTEKHSYRNELTFPHPDAHGRSLFCPWHGKVGKTSKTPYRIHFAWPEYPGDPLYVVYVGWKITV